jgi:serine/threonine protein kinase
VKKEGLTDEDKDALQVEIKILQEIRHPNIMSLVDHFEEPKMYYLVTELLEGGELFDRIVEKEYYTEKEARDLVKILLSAIKFIHDRNIVHRDLKPENLLLTSKSDDANIKIAGTVCSVSTVLPLLMYPPCRLWLREKVKLRRRAWIEHCVWHPWIRGPRDSARAEIRQDGGYCTLYCDQYCTLYHSHPTHHANTIGGCVEHRSDHLHPALRLPPLPPREPQHALQGKGCVLENAHIS